MQCYNIKITYIKLLYFLVNKRNVMNFNIKYSNNLIKLNMIYYE